MSRITGRVKLSRGSGLSNKRGTPLKTALSRRDKRRRLLFNKLSEALPEEPELEDTKVYTVKPISPVLTCIKPACCKSALHSSRPAFTENSRGKAVSLATPANKKSGNRVSPAGQPTVQTTSNADIFKGFKEEEQDLSVSPESLTSSSMETDTIFSSDDDEEEDDDDEMEEDCSSSAASSSLSSPEIFREDNYVESLTFPVEEELLGLHLHIKNSTLLDVSHAKSINMHHPPNLSTIIDASTILADNNYDNNQHSEPKDKNKIHMDSFKSDKALKGKTTPNLTNRKPISYKKKVWFKSPVCTETFEAKHTPATTLPVHNNSEMVQTCSLAEQRRPKANASRAGEISSEEETLQVKLGPAESGPEKAKFFDFIDDSDRDTFFQRMRESEDLFLMSWCKCLRTHLEVLWASYLNGSELGSRKGGQQTITVLVRWF